MTVIRFRRGNKADLPASAPSGMPLWCEDTKELYLGTGADIHLLNAKSSGGSSKAYAANSGKLNDEGCADYIEKVSETEVAFLVGGTNPNLKVTFPNGSSYDVSQINNISGIDSNGNYSFLLFEENLTDNGDGTHSATATPVALGYDFKSEENLLSGFTSNSKDGITLSGNHSTPWYACDGNTGTAWTPPIRTLCGNPYPFIPGAGGAAYITIQLPELKRFHKASLSQLDSGYRGSGKLQFSNNGGSSWVDITGISGSREIVLPEDTMAANAVRFYFTACGPWHSAGGDCGRCGMKLHEIGLYETEHISNGNIYEKLLLPDDATDGDYGVLINTHPLQSFKRESSQWSQCQFIKLGEVEKTTGVLGTPISYAFNGKYIQEFMANYNNYYDKDHNIGSDIIKTNVYVDHGGYWHDVNSGGSNGSANEGIKLAHKKNSVRVNLGKGELIEMSQHAWNVGTAYTANTRLMIERGF